MRVKLFLSMLVLFSVSAVRADILVPGFAEGSIRHLLDNGTQVAPITAGTVFGAAGITQGPDGLLYISCQTSLFGPPGTPDGIYKVNPLSGAVSPFINLPATAGVAYVPAGLKFGPNGDLYVARNGGQAAVAGSGSIDRYNATTGAFIDSPVTGLSQPTAFVFRGNDLFISNFAAGNVQRFDGTTTTTFASGGGLATPQGLTFGPDGKLYVVDLLAGAVRRYDGSTGATDGDLIAPGGALQNQFPSDLAFVGTNDLLIANLGLSFNPGDPPALHGSLMSFNATTGAFQSTLAADILGASSILIAPIPEPGSLLLAGGAAIWGWRVRQRRKAAGL